MKELINDLIQKSGLSNNDFAHAVGISPSQLSMFKRTRNINVEKIANWGKCLNIDYVEYFSKGVYVKIVLKFE